MNENLKSSNGKEPEVRMATYRQVVSTAGGVIPCIMIVPDNPIGAAVIIHGYGGCKEEQLGLAWRVAEQGLATCAIDLRGHGENALSLDREIYSDVNVVVSHCRPFGKVVAIGHSLGGRLALVSMADCAIGISPALGRTFGNQTRETLKSLRKYKVRDLETDDFLDVFKYLPEYEPCHDKPATIIYGSRDVPEIIAACTKLGSVIQVCQIASALHHDIFFNETTYQTIGRQLREWFP